MRLPSELDAICADCAANRGLCGRDHCRREVLPLLKRPTGLLRLMGEALVEQKARQNDDAELVVSDEQAAYKERKQKSRRREKLAASRKRARAIARSQRRGLFGLHQKIAHS